MKWIRYEEGYRSIHHTIGLAIVGLLFSTIYMQFLFAGAFGAVLFIAIIQNLYVAHVGKDLKMVEKKGRTYYLIDSESEYTIEFQNGKLPIWNGQLNISIQDAVQPATDNVRNFSGIYDFSIPFSIGRNKKAVITIPLKGKRRGLSRITRITLDIPHPFGDGVVKMELDGLIRHENLVYPPIEPYSESLEPSPFKLGEISQRHSLFHDVYQPIGTRDYEPGDRFDQIHWTASARMQALQTKQFLPVTSHSVLLVLNAIERPRDEEDFERKINRIASYIDYCTKHHIPYSIVINIQTFGVPPYIHIPTGEGKVQQQSSLEMLAQLSKYNAKIPFENLLQHIERKGDMPPTVVIITHDPERFNGVVGKWSKMRRVIVDSDYGRSQTEWNENSPVQTESM